MLNKRLWGMLGLLLGGSLWLAFDPPVTFRYPLDGYYALAGTFGELRSNHFHAGLDIKTYGRVRVPVKAAADGFVYRVKVSPYGYGKALYLRHADSSFTVYAHLDGFVPALEDTVSLRQYAAEQAEMEWYPTPGAFPFQQGEVIGYSGNTGSSSAPHLHFEIRDPKERILNGLDYFRDLFQDTRPPVLKKIAFEPIDNDTRINGQYKKWEVTPEGKGPDFVLADTLRISGGRFGIEYEAYDLLDAARNPCGVNTARLFLDDSLIYEFDLQRFAFDETRFLNLHIDYGYYKEDGDRLQKAYVDHGNLFSAYDHLKSWGLIELEDKHVHTFHLELIDTYGNLTQIRGHLQAAVPVDSLSEFSAFSDTPELSYQVKRDVWILAAHRPPAHYLKGLSYRTPNGSWRTWLPRYARGETLYFLMPLHPELYPEEIRDSAGTVLIRPGFRDELNPDRNRVVEIGEMQLFFPAQTVFSPLHLQVRELPKEAGAYSRTYDVGNPGDPLMKPYLLSFALPKDADPSALVVAKWDAKDKEWHFAGNLHNEEGSIYASVSEFGRFCLMADSTAPIVAPRNFSEGAFIPPARNTLQLKVEDQFSGIDSRSIRGSLDGEWILFEYDPRKDLISHSLRSRPAKGKHMLEVRVKDSAGNEQVRQVSLQF